MRQQTKRQAHRQARLAKIKAQMLLEQWEESGHCWCESCGRPWPYSKAADFLDLAHTVGRAHDFDDSPGNMSLLCNNLGNGCHRKFDQANQKAAEGLPVHVARRV